MRIIVMIIIAFVGKVPADTSRYNDNAPAKMRMRISGLLNWVSRSVSESDFFLDLRRFEPYFASLFSASSAVKPVGVV